MRPLHILYTTVALLLSLAVTASPGGSLVVDAKGNAYFTTAAGVWRQAPKQKPELIAPGLHVHHLLLDSSGALLGDHVWYTDDRQLNVAGHYNWRYTDGMGFERITDSIAGTPREKSLVQDAFGNRYALEYGIPCIIWQTDKYGNLTALAQVSFSRLGTLHITAKGVLLFANHGDVYALLPGDTPEKIASGIGEINPVTGDSSKAIIQLWSDNRRNIYAATGGVIKKIDYRRFVTPVYKSAPGWYPAGGWVSDAGDFWVLEYNAQNEARLQQIPMEVRKQIAAESRTKMLWMPLLLTAAVILLLYILFRKKRTGQ
ncbi:MAG: hypothetical protein ACK4E8_00475 [Lacibacter sp.]